MRRKAAHYETDEQRLIVSCHLSLVTRHLIKGVCMSPRNWLLALIGFGALCMLFVAILFAVSFFIISQRTATPAMVLPTWSDPTQVDQLKIDPVLSIATLAGTSELDAIAQMQRRGQLDAAYATTIYATSLTDRQRLGQLLSIGERYTAADKTPQAKLTFQAVLDTVALSPSLSDYERAEALAQAATAYFKLNDRNLAGLALDAGRDIALQSPFLKDAHRVTLLGKLLRAAQQGGDNTRVKKLNDDRSNFVDVTDTSAAAPVEPPNPLPPIEAPAKNDALAAAINKRMEAAKAIAQLKDSTVPDELISKLGDELFAEDDARMRTYNAPTNQVTLAQKVALARAQLEWLTLKYKVARKAFGVSIMPEWEDVESKISSQLAKAYENLYVLRNEQAVALPLAKDIRLAGSYLLRQQILAGRLGLYPNFPEDSLVDDLNNQTDELIQTQPNSTLRVKVEVSGDKYYYHLVDDQTWTGEVQNAGTKSTPTVSAPTPTVQSTPVATKASSAPTPSATQNASTPTPAPRPSPTSTRPYP